MTDSDGNIPVEENYLKKKFKICYVSRRDLLH